MNTRRLSALVAGAFLAGCMTVHAQTVFLGSNKVTLKQAFEKIEKASKYRIVYNATLIDTSRTHSVSKTEGDALELLKLVLQSAGCEYEINGNYITVRPKSSKTPSKSSNTNKKKISGQITDATGEPIIGATVMEKGTTKNGVITDLSGNYTIEIPSDGMLAVSYIGYKGQDIKVKGRDIINITLEDDNKVLDEVVVVGYGVQRKRDVSTAVSSVKAEALANNPSTDFRQTLAGKMPGVQVTVPSGDPEGSVSIRVRGVSTVNAGSDPLYVVDGVPMERGFANLNINDIESVEVLKDASAAAIYGSRGSNGVVLVTTKMGVSDKLAISYDGYAGTQTISKKLDMMNAYQYAAFVKDAHDNAYLDKNPRGSASDPNNLRKEGYMKIPDMLVPYLNGQSGLVDTDWQDAIFRTAMTMGHNISLSGRSNSINYFVSGNYMKKDGIIIGSDFEKYSGRLNLSGQHKRLKFGINFAPSYSVSNSVDASGANGIVQSALMMPPIFPIYNDDGSYNYQGNGYLRIGTDYQINEVLNL